MSDDAKKLEAHPLIEKLVPDPSHPERAVCLSGYLGKATTNDRVRLYPTLKSVDRYWELASSDVVHVQASATPEGRSQVWLKPDAKIICAQAADASVLDKLLSGRIATRARAAAPSGWTSAKPLAATASEQCISRTGTCTSKDIGHCGSDATCSDLGCISVQEICFSDNYAAGACETNNDCPSFDGPCHG